MGKPLDVYNDYAAEADKLTAAAEKLATAYENAKPTERSKRAWQAALSAIREAVAMHQRANMTSARPGGRHFKIYEGLNERHRAMRRLLPKVP
ncbi:hypothetical protein [Sorangium sp. So ce131]|uniref:hypothetical protein n=1 Tax=Sorangium sp. So ce131 TaxID=3133282 RepID=UPI003F5F844A